MLHLHELQVLRCVFVVERDREVNVIAHPQAKVSHDVFMLPRDKFDVQDGKLQLNSTDLNSSRSSRHEPNPYVIRETPSVSS